MAGIQRHLIDAVREATDITEVISRYVRLTPAGRDLRGLCPFHQEKSPSFQVTPSKGMYYCFGCQAGGDVFSFLMKIEGLSFSDAVKELARTAGIEVIEQEMTPEQRRAQAARADTFQVLEHAAAWYEEVLWTRPEGEPGRRYLASRGITVEAARGWRLGYAPGGWTPLVDAMHRQGIHPQQLARASLAKSKDGGGFYDVFRERVLFPIRDERGRVIGFGGRILEGDGPKYLNSPESEVYKKSEVLFGLDQARLGMSRKGRAIVVEGYFDVLALHQAGFTEAVGTCGTALTPAHISKLRRLTDKLYLSLDADEAGMRAARKVLDPVMASGFSCFRLTVPGGKDPDEALREEGPEIVERALVASPGLLEWSVDWDLQRAGYDAMSRERVLEGYLPLLKRHPQYIPWVAQKLHANEASLRERLQRVEAPPSGWDAPPPQAAAAAWSPTRDMVHLLWLAVHRRDQTADIFNRLDPRVLEHQRPVLPALARLQTGEPAAAVIAEEPDEGVRRALHAVVARQDLYTESAAGLGACDLVARLSEPAWKAALAEIDARFEEVRRGGDATAVGALLRERQAISSWIRALESAIKRRHIQDFLALLDRPPAGIGPDRGMPA